ncbi:MAG: OmpA family protein, partial [Nitrospiraceae bacterium]
ERTARGKIDSQMQALRSQHDKLEQLAADLKGERGVLQAKTEDLHRQLQTAQQSLAGSQKTVDDLNVRLAALDAEKSTLATGLADAQNQAQDLKIKLAAEQAQAAALREDKQKLMSGTTTAQEEIARLQKQAGQLETETARAEDLNKRLSERDQEIGRLRQEAADRETLAGKLAGLTDELEQTKRRIASLTADLAAAGDDLARTKQERDRLVAGIRKHEDASTAAGQELDRLRQEQAGLRAMLRKQEEGLKAEEEEKARLEQERLAKEAEIQRLAKTHEDLAKALEAEIAKGDIRIQQVRDRLTINMVDRVLFDSGQAHVKPAGLKVLKQVSDILKNVADKQIRIEGHTDNVPIGPKLRERFQTNWELSTARATTVVRFLIEDGGVDRSTLSASGYADTKPTTSNDMEEGRASNRRIEIVLYPKDLAVLADGH